MAASRRLVRSFSVLVALAALLALGVSAVTASTQRKLVYIDYNGGSLGSQPPRIFLTANAGPYLDHLRWSHWGSERATATGTFVSTCASCAPPRHRPARVVFHKIVNCTDPAGHRGHYRIYMDGTLTTERDHHPGIMRTIALPMNFELCREFNH